MYVEKKKISGKTYYYLKVSIRENGKVVTKTIAYLGKGDMNEIELKEAVKNAKNKLATTHSKQTEPHSNKSGSIVIIKTKDEEIKGTLIPSPDQNIEILKLKSGYNIGIEKNQIKSIKIIGKVEPVEFPSFKLKEQKELPGISLIVTGGTISSRLDYSTGAVKWLMNPEQLFFLAPKLFEVTKINQIEKPFMIASENMSWEHWQTLAKKAAELLNKKENQGIIITQGTDFLHYTASALSFMLKNLNKPVILTYSQKSTDRGSTDTVLNLTCSAYASLSNIAEVMLVGHETSNDTSCIAIRGTKVRKMSTSRRDTFRPINDLPLTRIEENGKITILNEHYNKRNNNKVIADTKFEEKVALIKFYPGADPNILDYFIKKSYKGIVIEAAGLGHVATDEALKLNWLPIIKKAISKGVTICFAPQTIYGRLNPYVYTPGRKLLEAGVIYLKDMLPETAYVKLGWVLGHEKEKEKIEKMMLKNISGEFNERISPDSFLY